MLAMVVRRRSARFLCSLLTVVNSEIAPNLTISSTQIQSANNTTPLLPIKSKIKTQTIPHKVHRLSLFPPSPGHKMASLVPNHPTPSTPPYQSHRLLPSNPRIQPAYEMQNRRLNPRMVYLPVHGMLKPKATVGDGEFERWMWCDGEGEMRRGAGAGEDGAQYAGVACSGAETNDAYEWTVQREDGEDDLCAFRVALYD